MDSGLNIGSGGDGGGGAVAGGDGGGNNRCNGKGIRFCTDGDNGDA